MNPLIDPANALVRPRLRLGTLVALGWFMLAGQVVALTFGTVFIDGGWLDGMTLGGIGLLAIGNLALAAAGPLRSGLRLWPALALLAALIGETALFLAGAGGLYNPFAALAILPLVIAADALGGRPLLVVFALTAAAALALFWLAPAPPPVTGAAGIAHGIALAAGLAVVGGGIAFHRLRGGEEARRLQAALTATELVLQREQHLKELDGLAAAAAHELGTPLGTITVVAKELSAECPPGTPFADDVALIRSEAERCRGILRKLTSLGTDEGGPLDRLPLGQLIEDIVAPHRNFGVALVIHLDGDGAREPVGGRDPAILYGLGNLVENAVDFAAARVDVAATWTADRVRIVIGDDGPGFPSAILSRIGEPYVTRRDGPAVDRAATGGGLGLGFFIAKTLLERSGARLSVANRPHPESGALVSIDWPRAAMDALGARS